MRTKFFSRLKSEHGSFTELSFCEDHDDLSDAIDEGEIDAVIVGCETGFSEFGYHAEDLAQRLKIDGGFMRRIAEWNRFTNERVSLLSISGPEGSKLRSLVLLPYGEQNRVGAASRIDDLSAIFHFATSITTLHSRPFE